MVVFWTILIAVGLLALTCGLLGLVPGRLDQIVLTNRRRLAALSAAGLLLVFAGSAPPVGASPDQVPTVTQPVAPPVRALVLQFESLWSTPPDPDVVDEQRTAYEHWESQVLTAYEKAERALDAVPAVLRALKDRELDRFTAWVHLARLKQDTNQARLAVTAIVPPAVLDLHMKERLYEALDRLNESLLSKRKFIAHLQHHVKTLDTEELERADIEAANATAALEEAVFEMIWVKARLGLTRERPAATAAAPQLSAPSTGTSLTKQAATMGTIIAWRTH